MHKGTVKILFDLDPYDWHRCPAETMWAQPVVVSGRPGFQIDNSPFYARGISFLDVVSATPTGHNGAFKFMRVLKRGGHSTYMLLMKPDDNRTPSYWAKLEHMGCSYESATEHLSIGIRTLYSVDVPPTTDLSKVYEALESGERDDVWVFQEGYAHVSDLPGSFAT